MDNADRADVLTCSSLERCRWEIALEQNLGECKLQAGETGYSLLLKPPLLLSGLSLLPLILTICFFNF